MKSFLKHLIFTIIFAISFTIAKGHEARINFLDSLDLSGLNEAQQLIINEEANNYAKAIAPLYETDRGAWKEKVKELINKIKDGLRIYKLARDPEIDIRIKEFESATNANVFIITYIEDSFLNNLFYRLAEAFYETTRPRSYVIFKFRFTRSPQSTQQNSLFAFKNDTIEIAKAIKFKVQPRLDLANAMVRENYLNANGSSSDATSFHQATVKSAKELMDLLQAAGIEGGNNSMGDPSATFIDPSGNAFTLKIGDQFKIVSAINNGPILSFLDNHGLLYKADLTGGNFLGYYNDKEGRFNEYDSQPEILPETWGLFVIRKDGELANTCYVPVEYVLEEKTFYSKQEKKKYTQIPSEYTSKKPLSLSEFFKYYPSCTNNDQIHIRFANTVVTEDQFSFGAEKVRRLTFKVITPELLVKKYEKLVPVKETTVSFVEGGYLVSIDKTTKKWSAKEVTEQDLKLLREQIEDGDIETESQVLIETQTKNGVTTTAVGALGYRNDLTPKREGFNWDDKTRKDVQTAQKNKINEKLYDKKIVDITTKTGGGSSSAFPDEVETKIKGLDWFETISQVTKESAAFIQDCKIPERMYNPDAPGYNNCIINTSPYFSGVGNAVVDEVTSIPQLVLLATDIVLDENTRNGLVESFKNLSLEKIQNGIVNTVTEIKDDITTSSVKGNYNKGTYTVTVVGIVLTGGAKKLMDVLDKADDGLAKNIDDIGAKMDEVAEGVGKLSDNLTGSLKKTYDDLIKAGYRVVEENNSIKFFKGSDEIAKISDDALHIKIPYDNGWAKQSNSVEALTALEKVNKGGQLYRIGKLGQSNAAEAQFWSLENPLDIKDIKVFAKKYGIPEENLIGSDLFVEVARPRQGAPFITRIAPGVGSNSGGDIELVIPKNDMVLETFHTLKF